MTTDQHTRQPAEVAGLPREQVAAWLREAVPSLDLGPHWTAEIITGGLSNITYRLHTADGTVILRRPPLAGALPSAHDMVREYTVQAALAATPTPVPRMLGLCTDQNVIGAPFYVMEDVAGQVLRSAAQTGSLTADVRAAVSTALVDALATLHRVDPDEVGLGGVGRPAGYTARQIRRWAQQWERSATRELPDMEKLFALLDERVPEQTDSAIVHGDFRLDNTVIDVSGPSPRIAAILDWELSTLGDPLADLGLFLTYWYDSHLSEDPAFEPTAHLTDHPGFPAAEEMAERYARSSGRDLSQLSFYRAFGAMKLAVILEGVHARYLSGKTVGEGYGQVARAVPVLTARALSFLRQR